MVRIVARYMLKPFMADAVVARPQMCCQGHVAHGTIVQVSHTPRFGLYASYATSGLRPLVVKIA